MTLRDRKNRMDRDVRIDEKKIRNVAFTVFYLSSRRWINTTFFISVERMNGKK